jgi:hypothetical protein
MASTEIRVGSVLDIQSLFIGSKLAESTRRMLRSAAEVGGGYFTYPPTCCLNFCILANWNFNHGIQQYLFCKAQQVNGVKFCDSLWKQTS